MDTANVYQAHNKCALPDCLPQDVCVLHPFYRDNTEIDHQAETEAGTPSGNLMLDHNAHTIPKYLQCNHLFGQQDIWIWWYVIFYGKFD